MFEFVYNKESYYNDDDILKNFTDVHFTLDCDIVGTTFFIEI